MSGVEVKINTWVDVVGLLAQKLTRAVGWAAQTLAGLVLQVLFFIAMLFSIGLAAGFVYFETAGLPMAFVVVAMLGLLALETVKVTRASHLSDLLGRRQWGRLCVNVLLWVLLAVSAFFMTFSAVNDHLFGIAVDKLGTEAQRVAQWQSDMNEKKSRRDEQVERAGGEPKTQEVAKAELDQHVMANPKDWERSRQCELVLPETRSTCSKYKELYASLATSSGVAGLDSEIAELKKKIEAASPEAQEAAKAISKVPRPRGLKALGMVVGLVDSNGADLSVAYLAVTLTIVVEFISNFLAYALELRLPMAFAGAGKRRVEPIVEGEEEPLVTKGSKGSATEGKKGSKNGAGTEGPKPPAGPKPTKGSKPSVTKGSQTLSGPATAGVSGGNIVRFEKPAKPLVTEGSGGSVREAYDAFVGTLSVEPRKRYELQALKAACATWFEEQGIEIEPTVQSLGPALKRAGFKPGYNGDSQRTYTDLRKVPKPAANDETSSPEVETA